MKKKVEKSRWDAYYKQPPGRRKYESNFPNAQHRERETKMTENNCRSLPERGINLNGLPEDSMIPTYINQQQWSTFILNPGEYDPDVVTQFYRNMLPGAFHEFGKVDVFGKQVVITPEKINQYHHTVNYPELKDLEGISTAEVFKIALNPEIAKSLRRNANGVWDTERHQLLKNELPIDLAFMLLFVKSKLRPATHVNTLHYEIAQIMYSIQHNLPLDVGRIIWTAMLNKGDSLKDSLPFACLITHFCKEAGVPIKNSMRPQNAFCTQTYDTQVKTAAKYDQKQAASLQQGTTVGSSRALVNRPSPGGRFEEFDDATPSYILALASQIGVHFDRMESRYTELRDSISTLDNRISNLHDRFDGFVAAVQEQHGTDVSTIPARVYQRQKRRRPNTKGASSSASQRL